MPTSGKAILITKKGDEMVETLVKEGEMVVIGPGVSHCISAVSGNYEQVVLQLPSAFHYGLNFKQIENLPDGYTMEALERSGLEKLRQKENGNI